MIPIMFPMNNSPASALGTAIGFLIFISVVIGCWVVRPIIMPRRGIWDKENYVVGGRIEGSITRWSSREVEAYSTPPMWVGLGEYERYTSEEEAKRKVEESCK